jgi:ankyrin repeat protein
MPKTMTYIRNYHRNLYRLLDFGLLVTPIVLQLLDKKVNTDVNKCRDDGTSPLCTACHKGHLDIVLQLLDKKVNW